MKDKAQIKVKAGDGGSGCISLITEFYRPRGGPDGGDGGKGGNVYLKATTSVNTLAFFNREREFFAENGLKGERNYRSGRSGKDLYITVPCGTVVYRVGDDNKSEIIADLKNHNDTKLVARGGLGGFGNAHFKSSRNQTPRIATKGQKGEEFILNLELKLISNVGFIGLPSVGKSSLLNFLVKSSYKTASYSFTTLSPNLGVLPLDKNRSLVLADLPGLIEGASEGRGLGEDFLRHAERCGVLIHILDINSTLAFMSGSTDYKLIGDQLYSKYNVINNELKMWGKKLVDKPQIVVLNKIDLLQSVDLKVLQKTLKNKIKVPIYSLSSSTGEGVSLLVKYFKENYKSIINYSIKQANKKSKDQEIYEVNLQNIPNKRLVQKGKFTFKKDNSAETDDDLEG